MSRQKLGAWGASLDGASLGCALAEAGVPNLHPTAATLAWDTPPGAYPPEGAVELAARWRARVAAISSGPTPARVRLAVRGTRRLDPAWLVDTLSLADGVSSVVFGVEDGGGVPAWDWPLDIGLLDDPASAALREAIEAQYWHRFVRFVDAVRAPSQVDVLLLPGALAESLALTLRLRLPEVHTVLCLGGAATSRSPIESLAALRAETGAAIAGALLVPLEIAKSWLDAVLFQLAHDLALDEALFRSQRAHLPEPAPLLFGRTGAFERARGSVIDRKLAGVLGVAPHDDPHDWLKEGEAATDVALRAPEAKRIRRAAAEARYLQARMNHVPPRGEPTVAEAIEPGLVHRLDVRIGAPHEDWAGAGTAFPSAGLPDDDEGHELTVVLIERQLFKEPQVGSLWLPATGDSTTCSFYFVPPDGLTTFDARVTVLYRNRIFQTLRIRADEGRYRSTSLLLSLEPEAVARTSFDGLSGTRGFDTALFFNDSAGEPGIAAFADGSTAYVTLHNVDGFVKGLRAELEKMTRTPGDYATTDSEATRLLLVTLARLGSQLLAGLRELPRMRAALPSPGDPPRRLQVYSIHPDQLVPVELAYDKKLPGRAAKLCPRWNADRSRRSCDDSCSNTEEHVCPLGFWGLRHVIERGLYDETQALAIQQRNAEAAFRSETTDGHRSTAAIKDVLLGFADKAQNFDATEFKSALGAMTTELSARGVNLATAGSWPEWLDGVKTRQPQLLLLLPHTEVDAGTPTLQIGTDTLDAPKISDGYVSAPPVTPPLPGPIVLLLGCRTAQDDIPFSSFIAEFRRAKASVVLGTIGTVRGRHMAPVARRAVELLVRPSLAATTSIGELVIELRRTLLANDLPVGMTFVAFGDVDWQLTPMIGALGATP